jgi:hypothetical protein
MNIAEPTGIMCHFEALGWINSLMIDLKLTLGGLEPQRPIDLPRLGEFEAVLKDLLTCQKPDTTSRWNTRTHDKHADAAGWLNLLVIDLIKPLLGFPPGRAVDMERLAEFRPFRQEIEGCMTSGAIVY